MAYHEMQGFPRVERVGSGAFVCRRRLMVPWSELDSVLSEICNQPWPYPPYNISPKPTCVSFTIVPLEGGIQSLSGSLGKYDYWQVDAEYAVLTSSGDGNPLNNVEEELLPFWYSVPAPSIDLRWGDKKVVPPAATDQRLYYGLKYIRRFMRLTSIPVAVFTGIGWVNNANVTAPSLGYTFAPATLLYAGAHTERTIGPGLIGAWKISQTFMFRPETWHVLWRYETSQWERVYSVEDDANPVKLYRETNFSIPT